MSVSGAADEPGVVGATVLRGGTLRLAGYATTIILSVVGAALLLRYLGEARAGRYFSAIAIVTIVGSLTDGGLTALALRDASTIHGDERAMILRNVLSLRIGLAVIGIGLAIAFAVAADYPEVVVAGVGLAGFGVVIQSIQLTMTIALQADLRQGVVTAADVMRQAVSVALFAVLIVADAELLWFLAVPIPAAIVSLVLTMRAVRGQGLSAPAVDRATIGRLLRDTLPFAIAAVANVIYFRMTLIALSLVASAAAVGSFGASFRVIEVLITVPGLIGLVAFPVLTRRASEPDSEDMYVAVLGLVQTGTAIGGLMAVVTVVGAPAIITVVAGPDFDNAADILQIQGLALMATVSASAWAFTLLALGRVKVLVWVNVAGLLVGGVLAVLLAESGGAHGAAWATVIGETLLAVGYGAALAIAVPRLRPPIMPFVRVAAAVAPAAAIALLAGLPSVIEAVLAGAAYCVVFVAIGGLPGPARDVLGRLRPR